MLQMILIFSPLMTLFLLSLVILVLVYEITDFEQKNEALIQINELLLLSFWIYWIGWIW